MGKFVVTIIIFVATIDAVLAQPRISAGVSLPVGPFANADSATGGFAKPGLSVGVEYGTKFYFGSEIGISAFLSVHPFDVAGFLRSQPHLPPGTSIKSDPWILLWPAVSLGYSAPVSRVISVYGRCYGGLFYGFYPEINSFELGKRFTQDMAIDVAFGWGVGIGTLLAGHYEVGLKVLSARPRYDVNVQGGGTSTNERQLQHTTALHITAGFVF